MIKLINQFLDLRIMETKDLLLVLNTIAKVDLTTDCSHLYKGPITIDGKDITYSMIHESFWMRFDSVKCNLVDGLSCLIVKCKVTNTHVKFIFEYDSYDGINNYYESMQWVEVKPVVVEIIEYRDVH